MNYKPHKLHTQEAGTGLTWDSPQPNSTHTAADQRQHLALVAFGAEGLPAVEQAKAHAFGNGIAEARGAMRQVETDEGAAHRQIVVRRALAAQSITLIWCQMAGSAWQNACSAETGLGWKASLQRKTTPEVPSETKPWPARTAPMPTALAALSPPPVTGMPARRRRRRARACPRRPTSR